MMSEMMNCVNSVCPRKGIIFQPPRKQKNCTACNHKLRFYWDGNGAQQSDDKPPAGFVREQLLLASTEAEKDEAFVGESNCDVKGCPVAPDGKVRVEVPWALYQQWVWLAKTYDVEWIAYLKGACVKGVWKIAEEGMYFPKQTATGTHVEAEDNSVEGEGIVAAVHSHVGMGAFFSGEDEKHFNHGVEFVVNNKGDIEAMVRVKLECGRYQRAKGKVMLMGADSVLSLEAALDKQLTIEKATVVSYGGGHFSST